MLNSNRIAELLDATSGPLYIEALIYTPGSGAAWRRVEVTRFRCR
jgi:hypothetical protein